MLEVHPTRDRPVHVRVRAIAVRARGWGGGWLTVWRRLLCNLYPADLRGVVSRLRRQTATASSLLFERWHGRRRRERRRRVRQRRRRPRREHRHGRGGGGRVTVARLVNDQPGPHANRLRRRGLDVALRLLLRVHVRSRRRGRGAGPLRAPRLDPERAAGGVVVGLVRGVGLGAGAWARARAGWSRRGWSRRLRLGQSGRAHRLPQHCHLLLDRQVLVLGRVRRRRDGVWGRRRSRRGSRLQQRGQWLGLPPRRRRRRRCRCRLNVSLRPRELERLRWCRGWGRGFCPRRGLRGTPTVLRWCRRRRRGRGRGRGRGWCLCLCWCPRRGLWSPPLELGRRRGRPLSRCWGRRRGRWWASPLQLLGWRRRGRRPRRWLRHVRRKRWRLRCRRVRER